jgi:hypothetical protein
MRNNFRQYLSVAIIALLTALVLPAAAQNGRNHDRDRDNGNSQVYGRSSQSYGNNSRAYQTGYQDGIRDAQRRGSPHPDPRQWKDSSDRQNYTAGYQAGYRQGMAAAQQQNGPYYGNGNGPYYGNGRYGQRGDRDQDGDRDHDHDRGYGPNGAYGAQGPYNRGAYGGYGNYGASELARVAQQSGYIDGQVYARRDMQRGNRFNPTGAKGYKDADHNYSSSLGSKDQFKQIYRQAFIQGYENAYRR